jgi:hypothetical protein
MLGIDVNMAQTKNKNLTIFCAELNDIRTSVHGGLSFGKLCLRLLNFYSSL